MKKIAQGAEAIIYQDKDTIIKDRIEKSYRHPVLDSKMRKSRTKREAKILDKLKAMRFPVPKVLEHKDSTIVIEHLKGKKLRDIFEKDYKKLSQEIGKKVAILHKHNIIHGDLTTSNMILEDEIYFIDFGLSITSTKVEDKAVDLHLLKRAMDSKHHTVSEDAFQLVIKAYDSYPDAKDVLKRLEIVEARGRNKNKGS